jgi:DNA transformation protein
MDAEDLKDLFRDFGPVSVRRMFGGQGVFADGMMIALVSRDVVHLKADVQTIPAFEGEGCAPFTYATKNGEHTLTSYWRMPERLYDDSEELARWARDAHAVAQRSAIRQRKPAETRKPASRVRDKKARKTR